MNRPTTTHSFRYVECDIPPGVSLSAWRTRRAPARRRHGLRINRLFA